MIHKTYLQVLSSWDDHNGLLWSEKSAFWLQPCCYTDVQIPMTRSGLSDERIILENRCWLPFVPIAPKKQRIAAKSLRLAQATEILSQIHSPPEAFKFSLLHLNKIWSTNFLILLSISDNETSKIIGCLWCMHTSILSTYKHIHVT